MKKNNFSYFMYLSYKFFCTAPAYAFGAEGAIIGGGAAAAGISLTMPQVALLVAVGFGLVYTASHAEELAQGLNNALENVATNIDNGIEELNAWKELATQGLIKLSSAPAWIQSTIKEWVVSQYETYHAPTVPTYSALEYAAGEPVPTVDFWNGTTKTFKVPVTALRTGRATFSNNRYKYEAIVVYVAASSAYGLSTSLTVNGTRYWVSWTNTSGYTTNSTEQKILESINSIIGLNYIEEIYNTGGNFEAIATALIKEWQYGNLAGTNGSICPDSIVGGLGNALDNYDISSVNIPDMDIGDSALFPKVGDQSIDEVLDDILTRLNAQELTWSQVAEDVMVGTPTVSIPVGDVVKDYPITDTGVSDIPIDDSIPSNPPVEGDVEVPEGLEPFTIALTDFFPFCIPFDIAAFVDILCAEPEAPCFEWEFQWYGGKAIH